MRGTERRQQAQTDDELRPWAFSIAYRMLGSVTEAEDVVQEAFLRLHRAIAEGVEVRSPRAFLTTLTTRLAIDHLRSARVRREEYVGEWLPEPIVTEADSPEEQAELADSLSMAFLVVLETLSPVERAVFLLHDVFDFEYAEIAEMVGKTEDNCRQIALRARRHVQARRPRFHARREQSEELAHRFLAALQGGKVQEVIELLAADAVAYGDGGGKAPAVREPIRGREAVARFMLGLARRARHTGTAVRAARVNGQPGFVAVESDGRIAGVVELEVVEGEVLGVRAVVNPDKLRHVRV